MSIKMAGIDHFRAEVDIRSKFAFTKKELDDTLTNLMESGKVTGAILISTCNRVELWTSVADGSELDVKKELCEQKGLPYEEYEEYLYSLTNEEAVDHLFRLSSGLESRILGEDQIVTQVKDALGKSRENFATDHVLEVLFRQAITAGKRVKTEVNLSIADRSVVHQAIKSLRAQGYDIAGRTCMVIGNGMMGKLAATALVENGANVTVTVRQYHNGLVQVPQGCEIIDYEDRMTLFPKCDMIVSATSSPNMTVTAEKVSKLTIDHDIHLIDLAVPRDIDPECASLEYLHLYDIDSFQIDVHSEKLMENIKKAEVILEEEKKEFFDYYEGRDLLPLIARLKEDAAKDLNARLTPVYHKLENGKMEHADLQAEVSAAAIRMMNKLLFRMKDELDTNAYRDCLTAMQTIFEEA